MPVANVGSKWVGGDLVFFDKATGTDVLRITTSTLGMVFETGEWIATSVDKVFFTATRKYRARGLTARVTVAGTDAGAVTAVVRKVASGTAIGSGTLLHTGTINLKGTADTNQVLTLSTTAADLELAAGDSLVLDFTGVLTGATGAVTANLIPV